MSETRRALLIGISVYEGLKDEKEDYQLKGACNDPELWTEVLTSDKYRFTDITSLTNGEASRAAILAAFDELVGKVGPDDVAFVLFSGHGSQLNSANPEEPDGRDETIIPADATGITGLENRKDITDDQLKQVLWALTKKTPRVTMVFDCCHSGSITRDALEPPVRGIGLDPRPRTQEEIDRAAAVVIPNAGARPTVISACRDDELSHDYEPGGGASYHGVLSWFLARELRNASPGATYRDVFEEAAPYVTDIYEYTHPTISGAIDRELFGIVDRRPMRYLPVTDRTGENVTIGGGAAQTVGIESRWAAYPAGALEPGPDDPLAMLVVTNAEATSATATGADGVALPNTVVAGTRVFRDRQRLDEVSAAARLPVCIEAADALAGFIEAPDALAGLIEASPLLRRVEPNDPTLYARVYTIGARTVAPANDPVPELQQVEEPTVAVVGPHGLLSPPRRAASTDAARQVRADLETFAQFKRVLELPGTAANIAGKVEIELLRRDPNSAASIADRDWVLATPDPVYRVGDHFGVRLTNRHNDALYVALLDLALNYGIGVLPGNEGDVTKVDAGKSYDVVTNGEGGNFVVNMKGYPFVDTDKQVDRGIERIKLFVTTQPANYDFLTQPGLDPDDFLTLPGVDPPDGVPGVRALVDEWTTVTQEVVIDREN